MSLTTPNLGLVKPELSDAADITEIDENWDTLDSMVTKRTGDIMTGSLEIQKDVPYLTLTPADTVKTELFKNATSEVDYGTVLKDTHGNKSISITLDAQQEKVTIQKAGNSYEVATLDDTGKVQVDQLPDMDYIPTSEKGVAGGVATLDESGMVPSEMLPEITSNLADMEGVLPITKGGTGATSAATALTNLGAAAATHIHTEYVPALNPVFTNSVSMGRTGGTLLGTNSVALGYSVEASNTATVAMGYSNKATGMYSTAMGYSSDATGTYSTALGRDSVVSGRSAFAVGEDNEASGDYSVAMGYSNLASGEGSVSIGYDNQATAIGAVALGYESNLNSTVGEYSFVAGKGSMASGTNAIAIGTGNKVNSNTSIGIGHTNFSTNSGVNSVAIGSNNNAYYTSGMYSSAIGGHNYTTGIYSSVIGYSNGVRGEGAFATGVSNYPSGNYSIGMGYSNEPSGAYSIAIGNNNATRSSEMSNQDYSIMIGHDNMACGEGAIAIGRQNNYVLPPKVVGDHSVAIGIGNDAEGDYSVAMGTNGYATASGAVAIGYTASATGHASFATNHLTIAEGNYSASFGYNSNAEGYGAFTAGAYTSAANRYSFTIGKLNKDLAGGATDSNKTGDVFVIGNGTGSTARSNAFRVTYSGAVYGLSSFNSSGADYAEFFEWQDQNPDNEDRVGYFVTLDGKMIKKAEPGDYILGIISGTPCIIGNSDEDWLGRWEHDEFGRFITEEVETKITEPRQIKVPRKDKDGNPIQKVEYIRQEVEVTDPETGETHVELERIEVPVVDDEGNPVYIMRPELEQYETGEVVKGLTYKANPDYDPDQPYIERKDRQEWDCVGMLGVLSVRDDGTCQVNGFAKVAEGAIATAADKHIHGETWRVIERVSDNVVRVIFK